MTPNDRINNGDDVGGVCALLIWGVPRTTRRKFKIACALHDTNMREVLLQLIKQYITDGPTRPRRRKEIK